MTFLKEKLVSFYIIFQNSFIAIGGVIMINKDLLDILVCPKCKGSLKLDKDNAKLICKECKLAYPIKDDIPVMLIEEAEKI